MKANPNDLIARALPAVRALADAACESECIPAGADVRVLFDRAPHPAVAVLARPGPDEEFIEIALWAGPVATDSESNAASTFPRPADSRPELPRLTHPCPGAALEGTFGPTTIVGEPAATYAGQNFEHFHLGCDWRGREGRPVVAVADGEVIAARPGPNGGVTIRHRPDLATDSGHLGRVLVRVGQHVQTGQKIGEFGCYAAPAVAPKQGKVHVSLYAAVDGENQLQPVDPVRYLAGLKPKGKR